MIAVDGSQLSNANLSGANLTGDNLSGANLTNANLTNANLTGADLDGTITSNTDFNGVKWSGATCPNRITYGGAGANSPYFDTVVSSVAETTCHRGFPLEKFSGMSRRQCAGTPHPASEANRPGSLG